MKDPTRLPEWLQRVEFLEAAALQNGKPLDISAVYALMKEYCVHCEVKRVEEEAAARQQEKMRREAEENKKERLRRRKVIKKYFVFLHEGAGLLFMFFAMMMICNALEETSILRKYFSSRNPDTVGIIFGVFGVQGTIMYLLESRRIFAVFSSFSFVSGFLISCLLVFWFSGQEELPWVPFWKAVFFSNIALMIVPFSLMSIFYVKLDIEKRNATNCEED